MFAVTVGSSAVTCRASSAWSFAPSVTPTRVTSRSPTFVSTAQSRHLPACSSVPLLIPRNPGTPASRLRFSTVPTPATSALRWSTMPESTGSASTISPMRTRSAVVLTVSGESPIASATCVPVSPCSASQAFAAATKASFEPYAQTPSAAA